MDGGLGGYAALLKWGGVALTGRLGAPVILVRRRREGATEVGVVGALVSSCLWSGDSAV